MKGMRGNIELKNFPFFPLNVVLVFFFKMDNGEILQLILLKRKRENTMLSFITNFMTNN